MASPSDKRAEQVKKQLDGLVNQTIIPALKEDFKPELNKKELADAVLYIGSRLIDFVRSQ